MFPLTDSVVTTTLNDRTVSSAQLDFLTPETFRNIFDQIKAKRITDTDKPWNYREDVTTPNRVVQYTICGYCNFPAHSHADLTTRWNKGRFVVHEDSDGFKQYCTRYAEDVTNPEVDFVREHSPFGYIDLPLQENIAPEFANTDDGYNYESADVELEKLDRYHDRNSEEHTVTLAEYRNGKRTNLDTTPEQRNAYVEGQEGFVSIKVLDDLLTRKYHARLLNIFFNKQGKRQIGSVVLQENTDGTRSAKCVKCKAALIVPTDPTRAQMEEFVYAIISHGNNHAAKWFRERQEAGVPLFYALAPSLNPPAENPESELVEHYRNCKAVGCKCANLLMQV